MKDLIKHLQLGLLVIILVSTIIAVFIEMINMYNAKSVTLAKEKCISGVPFFEIGKEFISGAQSILQLETVIKSNLS